MKQVDENEYKCLEGDHFFKVDQEQNDDLMKIKKIIEDQFNKGQSISNQEELSQIFKHVLIYQLKDLKIAMLMLVICFRQIKFIQDVQKIGLQTKLKESQEKKINRIIEKFLTSTQKGNPIQDIKNNFKIILENYKIFNECLFDILNQNHAKTLLQTYLTSQFLRRPNIQRLAINEVIGETINKLKDQEIDYKEWGQKKYFSVYLVNNKEDRNCWLVCVQSKQPQLNNKIQRKEGFQLKEHLNESQSNKLKPSQQHVNQQIKQITIVQSNFQKIIDIILRFIEFLVYTYAFYYYLFVLKKPVLSFLNDIPIQFI